jgi:hypothetical protein
VLQQPAATAAYADDSGTRTPYCGAVGEVGFGNASGTSQAKSGLCAGSGSALSLENLMIAEGEISAIEIFEDETEEMIASLDLKSLLQKRVPEKGQCPCLSTISTLPVKRGAWYTVFFLVGYPQPLPAVPRAAAFVARCMIPRARHAHFEPTAVTQCRVAQSPRNPPPLATLHRWLPERARACGAWARWIVGRRGVVE